MKRGVEYFEQALAKDPAYAQAYAGLADPYALLAGFGFSPGNEALPRAREAAQKALELDSTLAEAHIPVAIVKAQYDWDWSGSEEEFRRAIALSPNSARAHQAYGIALLATTGRLEEAIAESKRALELDPLSLLITSNLGAVFFYAHQYDQAIDQERKTLDLDPNFLPARYHLGMIYAQKSMYKEAATEFANATANPITLGGLGYVDAVSGKRTEAQDILKKLSELAKTQYDAPALIAQIYAGLGDKERAFEWLEKGLEEHSLPMIKVNPAYDPLRSDPRFADLLRRMNLQP